MRVQDLNMFDSNEFFTELSKFVLPTYRTINGKLELFGTSLVCMYRNHVFILNAKHTIEIAYDNYYGQKNYGLIVKFCNNTFYHLSPHNTMCHNKIDLAISKIEIEDQEKHEMHWLDFDQAYRTDLPQFRILIFTGYPVNLYKPRHNKPLAGFINYITQVKHPPYPKEIAEKVDPEYHIIGTWMPPTRGKTLTINADEALEEADLPGLNGISGGPVFLYDPQIDPRPYFAGIGIEKYKRQTQDYVIALRSEAIRNALNDFLKMIQA